MIMINDNKNNTIHFVQQYSKLGHRDSIFLKKRSLHKHKTHKYLNTLKKHNKALSLAKKCLDKIAKKIITFSLKTRLKQQAPKVSLIQSIG